MGTSVRTKENRVKNWTGTVHYADSNGQPACGPVQTHDSYIGYSVATVTCAKCIDQFGEDEAGHEDTTLPYFADEHAARRAQERAERSG